MRIRTYVFIVGVILLGLPFVSAANLTENLLEDFSLEWEVPVVSLEDDLAMTFYTVRGSSMDAFERMIYDSVTSNESYTESNATYIEGNRTFTKQVTIDKRSVLDGNTSLEELAEGVSVVIVVGNRWHNSITNDTYVSGLETVNSTKYLGQLIIRKADLDNNSKLIMFEHKTFGEDVKLKRKAAENSPLAAYVAPEYIPVVSTGIGVFLVNLYNIIKTVIEFLFLDVGRKKKVFGHTGPRVKGVYVKEVAALIGASVVLGFAVTWTYLGPGEGFLGLLALNSVLCLFAAISHEVAHRVVGRFFGIEIEYRFWPAGSIITVFTAFLGNSFGIQGFLMENGAENTKRWQYGITKLSAPVLSTAITVFAYLMFMKDPKVVYQMIYATSSIWAMAEILPVRGLDGFDIRNWSSIIWAVAFIVISAVFFITNFL